MPINETSAKTSIEFKYEHRDSEGKTTLTYNLQFSQTEQYGPTLTIYNSDGSIGAEVPVEMFLDTVNYLASRGVVQLPHTTRDVPERLVNMPIVSRNIDGLPPLGSLENAVAIDPLQSFSNSRNIQSAGLNMPTISSLETVSTDVVGEDLDMEAITAERVAATKKAKIDAKKFKPAHKSAK